MDQPHSEIVAAPLPHPALSLPAPTLAFDFQMSVALNPKIGVGVVPSGGQRNWISFAGGSWSASWGSGTVHVSSRGALPAPSTFPARGGLC